ncbi:MAG TPA: VOC family protein [Thermomonas sp.]|jgi:PhnB protein|uniref:VOC family protein n=1 Tax=Thermomonas sp. TaxID=1971895 RepID=UPI002C3B0B4B|nr:VOC family protein [Thermomonas sp.]HPM55723.1 VOC family protein [Thermomonas sp.]HPW11871.1 VOC family protein [Thermomonas sp.]
MKLIPYLMFREGKCQEAFAFYARALGGEIVSTATYGDMGPDIPEPMRPFIANIQLLAGGAMIMGADAMENPEGQATTSVNIEVDSIEDAERIFAAMSDGGQVRMPLAESQWALRFGMFDDRYGQPWMINLMKPAP